MTRLPGCVLLGALLFASIADAATAKPNLLPKEMLGLWSLDPADCAKDASEAHMAVEPKSVLFYETAHSIKRVATLPDGFLRASGYSVSDGDDRAPASLMLKLIAADKLQVGKTDGQIYHRCPAKRR